MYEVAPVSTTLWFTLFVCSLIFVMLNMLLAMIYDHYTIVKCQAGAFTGVASQMLAYLRDRRKALGCKDVFGCAKCCHKPDEEEQQEMARSSLKEAIKNMKANGKVTFAARCKLCCKMLCCGFCKCRCCRRRDDLMTHDEMLEWMMWQAGYEKDERQLVRRSVLGPKFQRKAIQTLLFTGQAFENGLGNESSNKDIVAGGAEPEYADELVEGALVHQTREADPEDLKTSQLRELVARAEGDIVTMRDRINECQGNVKVSLHAMAKQLQMIEELVHSSLAEMLLISSAAGVPDKVQRARWGAKGDSTTMSRIKRQLDAAEAAAPKKVSYLSVEGSKETVEDYHVAMASVQAHFKKTYRAKK
jgi:hypothetical protein